MSFSSIGSRFLVACLLLFLAVLGDPGLHAETLPRLFDGAPAGGRLMNLSARARVGAGSEVLVGGLSIQGGSARVLVRAIGPTLGTVFKVPGALSQSTLQAYRGGTVIAENSGWGNSATAAQTAALASRLGAFALEPNSADSAMVLTLDAGTYTFHMSGLGTATGVGLLEIYIDPDSGLDGVLVNLSARAFAGTEAEAIEAGFVVEGQAQVLVRGVGPELARSYSIPDALMQPKLRVYSGQSLVDETMDWSASFDSRQASALFTRVGAFDLPSGSRDAIDVLTLSGESRTVHLFGRDSGTGVAIAEVYLVPAPLAFRDKLSVGTHALGPFNNAERAALLNRMGSRVSRLSFGWDVMEPVKGQLNLAGMDAIIDTFLGAGIEPLMTVMGSPSWLTGNSDPFFVPTDPNPYSAWLEAYRHFVRRLAAHYAGRVTHWELWNEPNISEFWKPAPNIDAYASWAKMAAAEILAIDPTAHVAWGDVTIPEVAYNAGQISGRDFIRGLLERGIRPGIVSVHPYCYDNETPEFGYNDDGVNSFRDVEQIRRVLDVGGATGTELWITEYCWWAGSNKTFRIPTSPDLSEDQQADYFRRSLEMVAGWPSVTRVIWFVDSDLPGSIYNGAGIAREDGSLRPIAGVLREANTGR